MIINGALVRFRTRSRIELVAKARFMFSRSWFRTGRLAGATHLFRGCRRPCRRRKRERTGPVANAA